MKYKIEYSPPGRFIIFTRVTSVALYLCNESRFATLDDIRGFLESTEIAIKSKTGGDQLHWIQHKKNLVYIIEHYDQVMSEAKALLLKHSL